MRKALLTMAAACAVTTVFAMSAMAEENKLSVYAWDPNFNIPALEGAAEDYKQNVNPDFELEIITQSGSSDVEQAVTLAANAGDYSELPDIVLFQDHYIQNFVASYPDAWIPVEGADIDWSDFGEEKLSYGLIDGQHYGVPVDNGTAIFAYRVDLLEQAGYTIDDMTGCTWEKFIEVGEAVKEATGKYLLCMDGSGNDLMYMMMQAEGQSQWKDGEPYITENETLKRIMEVIVEMLQKDILVLGNDWTDYTNNNIQGDMVAGVMNGNWIIPTISSVPENNGKWELTSLPTLDGGEGYAANGGSALYITANCDNVDLAKDFLAKTFGGSKQTYDYALKNGGVITCCLSAGESEVYQEGVEYFNDQAIYSRIVEMGGHVPVVEQSDYHYQLRQLLGAALINTLQGADLESEMAAAEEQMRFTMGL